MHGVRTSAPRASDSGRLHGAPVPVRRIRGPGAQNRQVSLHGLREWTRKPEPDCHVGPTMSPLNVDGGRPPPGQVWGRADLRDTAVRSFHLLRSEETATIDPVDQR